MPIVASTPTSVYRYYDESDILIYVGVTSRGIKRNIEHNTTKDWWQFVTRQEVEHYDDRPTALAREKDLIVHFAPPFNRQHNAAADHIQSAYLMFREVQAHPTKLLAAIRECEGRLPLDTHAFGTHDYLVLRTRLADSSVAVALSVPKEDPPRVFGIRSATAGRIASVQPWGPVTLIHLSSRTRHPVISAFANLKFDNKRNLAVVRNIHVTLDHSDPDLCSTKCRKVHHPHKREVA